jgi:small multidrug resistance family-3 protein
MIIAAQFELTGCRSYWNWIHRHRTAWFSVLGVLAFSVYGGLQAIQPKDFGRSYAAYGGIFIVSALIWAWYAGEIAIDAGDVIGAILCGGGALVIMVWPGH